MNQSYKVALVAPVHIQVSDEWIHAVDSLGVDVIIVDDSNGKVQLPAHWDVYGYERQKEVLGDKYEYWQKFQKSSACKNFGHLVAYRAGYDIILGIDSDCIPGVGFVDAHIRNLLEPVPLWENTIPNTDWFPRGFPFSQRNGKCALSLGLWHNELDLYGTDRVEHPERQTDSPECKENRVAQTYLPLSGMNWATWRENIPELLFLPNHGNFRRHDDIWGGYIFQKQMLAKGERIRYGFPLVKHDTVVIPQEDADEEVAMIEHEDEFFASIDAGEPWPWVQEALAFWKSLYE